MNNRFLTLALRPLRHYADFSGRSSRSEFWIFTLVTAVLIKLVSIVTLTSLYLIGYEHEYQFHSHFKDGGVVIDHMVQPNNTESEGRNDEDPKQPSSDRSIDHSKFDFSDLVLEIHQHQGIEGYHLHVGLSDIGHPSGKLGQQDRMMKYRMLRHGSPAHYIADKAVWFVWLILALPLLSVGTRRLHDTGKSGWWLLLGLVPVAGWLVLAIFFALEGDKHPNRYGEADTP